MPQNKVKQGLAGQQAAEDYLTEKGWLILSRNFRTKAGEIDLIGKDGAYIVFAEVKLRRGLSYGYPRESVNYSKQQRIKKPRCII
jgi:putative endonuclease